MNKWLNKKTIIYSLVVGVFITLTLGQFVPSRRSYELKFNTPISPNLCASLNANTVTETSWGRPFQFTKLTDSACTGDTREWLIWGLIGNVLIWSATMYLVIVAIRGKVAK